MLNLLMAGAAGAALGAVLGWLAAAVRGAGARARAEALAGRLAELQNRLAAAADENTGLQTRLAALQAEQRAANEKLDWLGTAERQLRDTFQALAARSLRANAETFIGQARTQLDSALKQMRGDWSTQREQLNGLVQPVERNLKALDEQVRRLEERREGAYQSLERHLKDLGAAHRELRDETGHLRTALTTSSRARGQWGELQLRRLVEMAGLLSHVDFDEQQQQPGGGRPDMIIRLPHEGILPVDAKTSLQDYLKAVEAPDDDARKRLLKANAQAMRNHVRALSEKAYWEQFERTPDVVVMFVPNEACLAAAFEEDPELIDFGLRQHVLVATPVTLFGLLKALAYGWQQQAIAENARAIAREGRELCDRFNVFLGHLQKSGRGLDMAVRAFNEAIGSAESRLLPSARRLRELGATQREPERTALVDRQVRLPAAEEARTASAPADASDAPGPVL